jgi:hypothetical protein
LNTEADAALRQNIVSVVSQALTKKQNTKQVGSSQRSDPSRYAVKVEAAAIPFEGFHPSGKPTFSSVQEQSGCGDGQPP